MNEEKEYLRIKEAACFIKEKTGDFTPEILAVLGSGLGSYAQSENVQKVCEIAYSEIPGMPTSTVKGHAGKFVFGYVEGKSVMFMQGRVHLYEGYSPLDAVLPIRIARVLGATKLILTNAAGGVNTSFEPGDFMLITDHISCFVTSSLKGENLEDLGTRFPDMTEVYSLKMQETAEKICNNLGINLKKGVYIQLPGPQYETPAEIRMIRTLGADAVGMSTVIEAIAARHAGMEICAVSCITNMATGISAQKLSHEEVQVIANKSEKNFERIMTELAKSI